MGHLKEDPSENGFGFTLYVALDAKSWLNRIVGPSRILPKENCDESFIMKLPEGLLE